MGGKTGMKEAKDSFVQLSLTNSHKQMISECIELLIDAYIVADCLL